METSASAAEARARGRPPLPPPHPPSRTAPRSSCAACRPRTSSYLWGYPGGAVLYIYDALYKQETIQHVLVRHEQAAVHAADGYARATGEVGVALVTSGPGRHQRRHRHRHRLHGLDPDGDRHRPGADAGDRPRRLPGVRHGRHHAADRQAQLPRQGRARPGGDDKKAFHIARTGRPGPVRGRHPEGRVDDDARRSTTRRASRCARTTRSRRATAARSARRCSCCSPPSGPYIYTGGGVDPRQRLGASCAQLVDLLGFPCTNTLMGLGAYPRERPEVPRHARHARHLRSQHGDAELRRPARHRRPLRRPRDRQPEALRVGRAQDHPHRHRPVVDLQARQGRHADRRRRQGRAAGADRRSSARRPSKPDVKALSPWWAQINEWRKKDCLAYDRRARDVIKPQHVVETLWELTKDRETYITSDVGQHQMWAAQYYRFDEPRRWINSGGLGTMGVGLPYAMGIKLAKPGRRGRLHHRRRLDPDVHPGALDLPAVQDAGQDRLAQQPLPRHGAPVAADRLRRPLFAQLHGRAARLREARRGLRPRRHPHRQARARSSRRCAKHAAR